MVEDARHVKKRAWLAVGPISTFIHQNRLYQSIMHVFGAGPNVHIKDSYVVSLVSSRYIKTLTRYTSIPQTLRQKNLRPRVSFMPAVTD
jgi:hypothetical protein